MKFIVHNKSPEIGGSCVELISGNSKAVIDFGIPPHDIMSDPLKAKDIIPRSTSDLRSSGLLPGIEGLYKEDTAGVDAVILSGGNIYNYDLLSRIHPDIPVYMSGPAKALIEVSNIFMHNKTGNIDASSLKKGKIVKAGTFFIMPYLVDRLAYDCMAFLVESGGKRIFYSGDTRGYGRGRLLFENMIKDPPDNIDCLLTKCPGSPVAQPAHKYNVRDRVSEMMKGAKNVTFLLSDPEDIDSLTAAYGACRRSGCVFVIDLFAAFLLGKLSKFFGDIPQYDKADIRIKFLSAQKGRLEERGYGPLIYELGKRSIDIFEINRKKSKMLILCRDDETFPETVKKIEGVKGASVISTVKDNRVSDKFRDYCSRKELVIENLYTDNPPSIEDLLSFQDALKPGKIAFTDPRVPDKCHGIFKNIMDAGIAAATGV